MLDGKPGKAGRILTVLVMISYLLITVTSCITYPPEKVEKSEYLVVDFVPDLAVFSPDNPELKRIVITQIDLYENIMLHLLSMKVTGAFVSENIDDEILYCQEILDYLNSITEKEIEE